jgi:hypothetical protein
MASLQAQLARLELPGTARQFAVASVFDGLASGAAPTAQGPPSAAIRQCLCLPDAGAVGLAVRRVVDMVETGRLGAADAQAQLLTALSVASAATAAPLAAGAVALFQAAPSGPLLPWRSHPLSKALLSSPAAGPELVAGVCRTVAAAAAAAAAAAPPGGAAAAEGLPPALAALRPFIAFVLLDPELAAQQPHLAPALRGGLVRAGCAHAAAPAAQLALLRELVRHLPAARVATAQQQMAAEAMVGDVLDLLEACQEEPGGCRRC